MSGRTAAAVPLSTAAPEPVVTAQTLGETPTRTGYYCKKVGCDGLGVAIGEDPKPRSITYEL
ncbi:hypothetical protein N9D61_03495 [Planktomarina sp.]|nr:hypothetical protein [Planktomarina sp.]